MADYANWLEDALIEFYVTSNDRDEIKITEQYDSQQQPERFFRAVVPQPSLDELTLPDSPPVDKVLQSVFQDKYNQLDELLIEALRLKGFEFKTREQLIGFFRTNVFCEDDLGRKQKTFYITGFNGNEGVPFFLYVYANAGIIGGVDSEFGAKVDFSKIEWSHGQYAFL